MNKLVYKSRVYSPWLPLVVVISANASVEPNKTSAPLMYSQ